MEIRILTTEEIPYAISLSKQVYDFAIRNRQVDPSYNKFFDDYMSGGLITEQVQNGQLVVWGALENGQLVGVSAMTSFGHITMLYVHAYFLKRKIGRRLLEEMKTYAGKVLQLEYVTVNATPAWTSAYFTKRGFRMTDITQNYASLYISLQAKSNKDQIYKTRPVSTKALVTSIVVFLCLILGSSFGYILYFLATH